MPDEQSLQAGVKKSVQSIGGTKVRFKEVCFKPLYKGSVKWDVLRKNFPFWFKTREVGTIL